MIIRDPPVAAAAHVLSHHRAQSMREKTIDSSVGAPDGEREGGGGKEENGKF